MRPEFVHLSVHTEYSLVDGIVRVPDLVKAAAQAGMPAVAVTERGNLFSLVKFYRAAEAAGIKPIAGVDLAVHEDGDGAAPSRLLLLCQDRDGYRNLTRLLSRGYLEGQVGGQPTVRRAWLEDLAGGLIALSGGAAGDVGQALAAGRRELAEERAAAWESLFPGRFYLELHRTGREGERACVQATLELAAARRLPVVATNDVRFLNADDFEAHEARVCIHQGRTLADPRRPRAYSESQYLRTPAEMAELFADVPEALQNSVEIARRCNLELTLGESVLPDFPTPAGRDLAEWLRAKAAEGLARRLAESGIERADQAPYEERLRTELDVIIDMGFPGYFLIVADFIEWARDNGIPVGPGRGSGAGSLVAYALGITDLDPLEHDLLFERFLNPERVSMPDFDIDFCMEGRDRVIDYVSTRYGADRVAQIITFGSLAAKAVVRDVGRVLGHPYGFVDQLAKLIPFQIGMTLERALDEEDRLRARYEEEEEVRALIDLAAKLEGLARNAGRHAGGVVIAPTALTDFAPLYCEPGGGSAVTQFDKDDVEAVGLVKFDFLGLRTLTIIDRAVHTINEERTARGESPLDVAHLPLDDAATYELIRRADTTAVFQLESHAMKDLIRRLQPSNFEDLIALNALIRPGPSELADDFIKRKHGRAEVVYFHPDLEEVLKPTYGVILYQEQVMQIAQVLAGYTLGGADLLRRAMGKKKPEEMAKQRAVFVEGASARGVDSRTASATFDVMEKFAGYGFNKSHSAAYALVAYQTGWLKAHYPQHFMAAVLSADMDNTDKVVILRDDCRDMGVEVLPPHVNQCERTFTVAGERAIRYGLGAIKGVGAGAIEAILREREATGPFTDLFDFCRRVDPRRVNRRVVEALVRCGALDGLGPGRAAMMASLTPALHAAEQHARDSMVGQDDLFGGAAVVAAEPATRFADVPEWSEAERLAGEKDTLGLYLSGHPIDRYRAELAKMTTARLSDLRPGTSATARVAGLLLRVRALNSRNGRMAVLTLDDGTARVEAVVYAEPYRRYRDLLLKDRLLVVEGEVTADDVSGTASLRVERVVDVDSAREERARALLISVVNDVAGNGFADDLARILSPFRSGATPVLVEYRRPEGSVRVPLGEAWRVRPADELIDRLRHVEGAERVEVEY